MIPIVQGHICTADLNILTDFLKYYLQKVCQLSVKQKHHTAVCVQFAEKYGNIFNLHIFGGRAVIINSYKLVKEALVHNGMDYEDRPAVPLFEELVGNRGSVCCILLKKLPIST